MQTRRGKRTFAREWKWQTRGRQSVFRGHNVLYSDGGGARRLLLPRCIQFRREVGTELARIGRTRLKPHFSNSGALQYPSSNGFSAKCSGLIYCIATTPPCPANKNVRFLFSAGSFPFLSQPAPSLSFPLIWRRESTAKQVEENLIVARHRRDVDKNAAKSPPISCVRAF